MYYGLAKEGKVTQFSSKPFVTGKVLSIKDSKVQSSYLEVDSLLEYPEEATEKDILEIEEKHRQKIEQMEKDVLEGKLQKYKQKYFRLSEKKIPFTRYENELIEGQIEVEDSVYQMKEFYEIVVKDGKAVLGERLLRNEKEDG